MDSKGELLITIMWSLAQEESRSISENVTWGQRKRFADGKVSIPYGHFLGYRKGANGLPEIVPEEAEVIRAIYRMFIEGQLKRLREQYPVGTRVELIHIDDPYDRKLIPGCQGTVRWVDDMGTIHVNWDRGSGLGLIPSEDTFKKKRRPLKKAHRSGSGSHLVIAGTK